MFDLYGSATQAVFTGTPPQICTAIIARYSDGELGAADLVIQANSTTYTAKFDPAGGVLDGLMEWLGGWNTHHGSAYNIIIDQSIYNRCGSYPNSKAA